MDSKLEKRVREVCKTHKTDMVLVVGKDVFLPANKTLAKDHASKTKQKCQVVSLAQLDNQAQAEGQGETPPDGGAKDPGKGKTTGKSK